MTDPDGSPRPPAQCPVEPIGVIRTARRRLADTPVQSVLNWQEVGEVHVHPWCAPALEGLDGFSHAWLLSWLHQPGQPIGADVPLRQVPFLLRPGGSAKGILATRGPRRPNPIGLHLVRLAGITVDPPVVAFEGVDMADGTPVVDLKPWVAHFDHPPAGDDIRGGWLDDVTFDRRTPAELDRPDPRHQHR